VPPAAGSGARKSKSKIKDQQTRSWCGLKCGETVVLESKFLLLPVLLRL